MGVEVKSITTRFEKLATDRAGWDNVWREIVDVCFPSGPRMEFLDGMRGSMPPEGMWSEPRSARRARKMYDATGAIALDRVTAGVESLITPQGQQWHELAIAGPVASQPTLEEEGWLDRVVDYLFRVRYDPRSGWLLAHQRALMSTLALGTGVYMCEEAFGARDRDEVQLPFRCKPVPLNEAYLACNDWGEHDTILRAFNLTATQAMSKFGDDNSDVVKTHASDPAKQDKYFRFIHAIVPAEQLPGYDGDFAWASVYIDLDQRKLVRQSGYNEFAAIVYTWTLPTHSPYGESPAMVALPEMKSLQAMSRDALLASQLGVRPPVATAYELDRPVNLNPGAINPKMVDPNTGRPLIAPILSPGDPRLFELTMEQRRASIRQALFTDLFAVLVDKPNMSATEAAIRNQEKGELLGPAASRVQVGLSRLVDRELAILERKGAFRPGSLFAPPETMQGRDVEVKFVSPIDRARQMPEITGMQQALAFAGAIAQFDPTVLDNFDTDAMFSRARYLLGAPPLAQRNPELVQGLRQEKAQAQSAQDAMAATAGAVDVASQLGPAAEGMSAMAQLMQNAGIDPSTVAGIPQGEA
jgi:hypothetical protein